jgi:hypothetical protein
VSVCVNVGGGGTEGGAEKVRVHSAVTWRTTGCGSVVASLPQAARQRGSSKATYKGLGETNMTTSGQWEAPSQRVADLVACWHIASAA